MRADAKEVSSKVDHRAQTLRRKRALEMAVRCEALEARRLMAVTVPSGWVKVGQASVPGNSFAYTYSKDLQGNQASLVDGVDFKLKASGTFEFVKQNGEPQYADAEFAYVNKTASPDIRARNTNVDYGITVDDDTPPTIANNSNGSPGPQYQKPNRWTTLGGAKDLQNEYLADYEGTGNAAKFFYLDDHYSDNIGSLNVDIYAQEVSVKVADAHAVESREDSAQFVVRRGVATDSPLTVYFTIGGTAGNGADYDQVAASVTIPANKQQALVNIKPIVDAIFEGNETVELTLVEDPNGLAYKIKEGPAGAPDRYTSAVATIVDFQICDIPIVGKWLCINGAWKWVAGNSGAEGQAAPTSTNPVRYFDGVVDFTSTDLSSDGFGSTLGHTRSWTNQTGVSVVNVNGKNTLIAEQASLFQMPDGGIAVIGAGLEGLYFDALAGGGYAARFNAPHRLIADGANGELQLVDPDGATVTFHDFAQGNVSGLLKSATTTGGVTINYSYNSSGRVTRMERTAAGSAEADALAYTYLTTGENAGLIASVSLERRNPGGSSWRIVRTVNYDYYGTDDANGTQGDLKTAVTWEDLDADATLDAPEMIETKYYRYHTAASETGFAGALKFVVNGASYSRMIGAGLDPQTATDEQVALYADNHFEYDASRRVVKEVAQGEGCSTCSSSQGRGTFQFAYQDNPSWSSTLTDQHNSWRRKTVETLPDSNQNIVYTNNFGQVILSIFKDTTSGQQWREYRRFDADGRVILSAGPSAVSGHDEASIDLVGYSGGNATHLSDSAGLVQEFIYYTPTDTDPGASAGYLKEERLRKGETGTAVPQRTLAYVIHGSGDEAVTRTASETVYRNSDGTGAQTTSYSYVLDSGSTFVRERVVTLPTITGSQNGPGVAVSTTSVYDDFGRAIWMRGGAGFITHQSYDDDTGALLERTEDVDTALTSDEPVGWTTPTGGGLHLTTTMEVDDLGRTVKLTDPKGNITHMLYNDAEHEVRTYRGWTGSDTTGPIEVYREHRPRAAGEVLYTETLTSSATPTVSAGAPTGLETLDTSNIQSLSRSITSNAGQVIETNAYFSLAGVTYSRSSARLGTASNSSSAGNYHRTLIDYDQRGRVKRVEAPSGTITRTVYDGLGRLSGTWVGTNDTGATNSDPDGSGGPNNMVLVTQNHYDNGSVGDSNLTRITAYPRGGADARITEMAYDWRNRVITTKIGGNGSDTEGTDTQSSIRYCTLDNLGQDTACFIYDGDELDIQADANSDGIPDQPSSSALRGKQSKEFDDQGRVFKSETFSVDPTNGTISSGALTSETWFDKRGNVIKTSSPSGLVSKMRYDGAGRLKVSYSTDGASDSSWTDATQVSDDTVLEQAEYAYDDNGNVLLTTLRQRFHDATGTGDLRDPTTQPKARVSYAASYYDALDRTTASVNVGTNGGSAYTRPSSVPARSDTVLVTSYTYDDAGRLQDVTDPKGLITRSEYDALGRTTATIEAYTDGVPSDDDDRITRYTYDGNGNILSLTADLPTGQTDQTTTYTYGVGSGSNIFSNDLLAKVTYPDVDSDGATGDEELFTYNTLGQRTSKTDRNGSVHEYDYDTLGRLNSDEVTTLGSGVDGAVRKLTFTYNTQGLAEKFTSRDASNAIVNEVQRAYNGLGQLTDEYQAHDGAVNTLTTPKVQYAYSTLGAGSRLTSMTYPNGKVLSYNYASGLDDFIGRLSSLSDSTGTLEGFTYLGLGTVVQRTRGNGVDLTYIDSTTTGDAGDQYVGLDRFGRVVDQRWTDGTTDVDRFGYTYDRNSNRTSKTNNLNSSFSETYAYDDLDRLTSFSRTARSQAWDLDALGNWQSVTTNGNAQTRSHNDQNQITDLGGTPQFTYDGNGNMTAWAAKAFTYDAWNRLVATSTGSTYGHVYDALGRRILEGEKSGTSAAAGRELYYSAGWQVIEERESGVLKAQYVWSPVYVDAQVLRDYDTDGDGTLDQRLYAHQDANFNVTSMADGTGAVVERITYDPYGKPTFLTPTWGSRSVTAYDLQYLHQGGRYHRPTFLYHFRNRETSPDLGRWMQQDPLGYTDGTSLYGYLQGNPLTHTDPHGLQTTQPTPQRQVRETYEEFIERRRRELGELPRGHWEAHLDQIRRGCIGVVQSYMGVERINQLDWTKDCYTTKELAERRAKEMAEDPRHRGCSPQIYSIHLWESGRGKDRRNPDLTVDPNTGAADLSNWDGGGRPAGDWNDGQPGIKFDFGFLHADGTLSHATTGYNPDKDGDGRGDYFPAERIVSDGRYLRSTLAEWQAGAPEYYQYADFNREVWCVQCKY
jgi:RHS repeat-associated protein